MICNYIFFLIKGNEHRLKILEITFKSLTETNIVGKVHNVSGFSNSFSVTLQRSRQIKDKSGFP